MFWTNLLCFLKRISILLKIDLLRTFLLFCQVKSQGVKILVFPNVHCGIKSGVAVEGAGRLRLGCRWPLRRYMPSELALYSGAILKVEGRFSIYTGCSILIKPGGKLTLGSGYINTSAVIRCCNEIAIGHNVAIASGVTIMDSDFHALKANTKTSAPIRIGNHVWCGVNATILKGVTIGDGAVIAAGAVVTNILLPI